MLLDSATAKPPAGAAEVRVIVPCEDVPPVTVVGFTDTAERLAGAAGGVTVSVALRVAPPKVPVMVTGVEAVTDVVLTGNVALVTPDATVTLAGTVAVVVLLESVTTAPPAGAADVSVAVADEVSPPTMLVGLSVIAESVGAVADVCGVKRSTEDHAPAVPAELIPCTRHQCRTAAKVGAVNCDAVTVRSTTIGIEKVLESSICMR